ncbi:MAG: hypothetical protein DMG40_11760 [Acidobacteria bacterium]|nr:MAG: hypothetical protein DMG40_11760 [Acidobacteriota bacterium]
MANPIITLTTDYGTNDHLVGTLKGVILKVNPDVTIVDITHNVTPFDLLDGGTERRPILVSAGNQYFVAPDNGVLSVIYEREPENLLVRHANAEHYYFQPVSKTFHGRDIFAPVAAWLTKNWQPSSMGEEIQDYKRFALPRPKEAEGALKGVVLRTDSFGNLVTNFRQEDLPEGALNGGAINLQIGNQAVTRFVETFAQGNGAEPFAYLGSSGFVEIGVNKGNAARTLGLNRGMAVVLTK